MQTLEVFADVGCPFAHAGLARFHAFREERGLALPVLRVRAWPLELVNAKALDGTTLVPKIDALRTGVATDRFRGFDPLTFPTTTLPAMISEAAAYRAGSNVGERFSLAVRQALFDDGEDVSDPDVLRRIRDECAVGHPTALDEAAVHTDLADGRARGVEGSPHFFTPKGDFYCPSLRIEHDESGYDVTFDGVGFDQFVTAVFA